MLLRDELLGDLGSPLVELRGSVSGLAEQDVFGVADCFDERIEVRRAVEGAREILELSDDHVV